MNVNQVEVLDTTTIAVNTYERGVNRITQACGTGSTSSAVLSFLLNKVQNATIHVQTSGGALVIAYNAQQNRSMLQVPPEYAAHITNRIGNYDMGSWF